MQRIFDPRVFQLGYVALDTPDLGRAADHYAEAIGMTATDRGHDGELYLSVGFDHHNIVLRPASARAIGGIGFQLRPGTELGEFLRDARDFGVEGEIRSDSRPGIPRLVELELPNDLRMQFYADMAAPAPGFRQAGVAPLRLGHVAIMNTDGDRLSAFFDDFLGFWCTDTFGTFFNFYTCNREHHVVNVVKGAENRYHHIAFQLRDNASHPMAADSLRRRGVKQEWGPARHPASHNIAGYHRDPDGVMVELYTDMDVFIPELNMCEPRPWHEHFPMRPRNWEGSDLNAWGAEFTCTLG